MGVGMSLNRRYRPVKLHFKSTIIIGKTNKQCLTKIFGAKLVFAANYAV